MWRTADPHTGVQIPLRPLILQLEEIFIMNINLREHSLIFIIILLFLYFLSNAYFVAADHIIINEVMINPSEPDQTNEWI